MKDVYYEYDDEGELIPVEYMRGNIITGEKSSLPSGRYIDRDGKKIRIGNSIGAVNFGGSDALGEGVQGMINPVDGKKYDSKSQYYRAVKAAGCEIMGNDAPSERKIPQSEKIDWKRAVKETIDQLSPTKKGKKK